MGNFRQQNYECDISNMPDDNAYRYLDQLGTEETIRTGKLRLSSPLKFNDPFDCQIHVDTNFTDNELKKYSDLILKKKSPNLNREERRCMIKKNSKRVVIDDCFNKIEELFKNELRICSFSAECDNILLWSHYAMKHEGACLGFNINNGILRYSLFPIHYSQIWPKYNYVKDKLSGNFDERNELVDKLFLTKAKSWVICTVNCGHQNLHAALPNSHSFCKNSTGDRYPNLECNLCRL